MKSPRFWVIVVLLTSTIFVLQSRGDVDQVPPSEPLNLMPRNFGPWAARDIPLSVDTLEAKQIEHNDRCQDEAGPVFSHDGRYLAYDCYPASSDFAIA